MGSDTNDARQRSVASLENIVRLLEQVHAESRKVSVDKGELESLAEEALEEARRELSEVRGQLSPRS